MHACGKFSLQATADKIETQTPQKIVLPPLVAPDITLGGVEQHTASKLTHQDPQLRLRNLSYVVGIDFTICGKATGQRIVALAFVLCEDHTVQ